MLFVECFISSRIEICEQPEVVLHCSDWNQSCALQILITQVHYSYNFSTTHPTRNLLFKKVRLCSCQQLTFTHVAPRLIPINKPINLTLRSD